MLQGVNTRFFRLDPTQRKEHDIACKANTIEIRRLVPEPNRVVYYTCFVCKGFPNIQNSAHSMFQIIQLMYVLGAVLVIFVVFVL